MVHSNFFIVGFAGLCRASSNAIKDLKTKILSASIRNIDHVKEVAKAGSDIATIPPKVFHEMYKHELTDKGLKIFLDDWNSTNQKIS